ncbi:hypothetical protein B9Z65_4299 [Elsinoe australis]|uniref:Rhodopsin domain-containing protein n=1 Tax=Elsinoe australis TaxID=40998 RepID=A0A2P7Z2E5_9PEZI|nr:hypothetical protein B9Z65_4299 [Elsinoe australis]
MDDHGSGGKLSAKIIVFISFLAFVLPVASLAVALRTWVRIRITKSFGKDDYTLVFSHIVNLICAGFWMNVYIRQKDYEPRSTELFDTLATSYLVAFACYIVASLFIKFAIGFFFLRIAQNPWQKYVVFIPLGIYSTSIFVTIFIVLFRCGTPIDAFAIIGSDSCRIAASIAQPLGLNNATLNALCDWIFAAIPVHMLLTSRRMRSSSRISICIIISLAIAGSIVSLIRIPYFVGSTFGPGAIESTPAILFLSIMETAVATIAISLATLKPLLRMLRPTVDVPENIKARDILAEGRAPPGASDWLYTACMTKTDGSKRVDMLNLRGLGILPDVTLDGTNASRDDEEANLPVRPQRVQMTMVQISRHTTLFPPIGEVLSEATRSGSECSYTKSPYACGT